MTSKLDHQHNYKFHFSGICGAGMGNVAILLHQAGYSIKGSDGSYFPPMSDQLKLLGVKLFDSYNHNNITSDFTPDIQVISNVLSKNHEEVLAGKEHEISYMSFPEVLEKFILAERDNIVVAGTHGKTTTSSLLSRMLSSLNPGFFIGGVMKDNQPGCELGDPKAPFVIEGDEYDTAYFDKHSKFLHYKPKYVILTYLEWDHVDIFPTFEKMISEFRSLLEIIPEDGCVVYCGDQPILKDLLENQPFKTISYGFNPQNDVIIGEITKNGSKRNIEINSGDEQVGIETTLFGNIYVSNLTAAWTMARHIGLNHEEIIENFGSFEGAKRRLELINSKPFLIYSDFAHHPTAIEATIRILLEEYPNKKIWAIFDPRNATSRRNVFAENIIKALNLAHKVSIGPVIEDNRIPESERFNTQEVASQIGPKAKAYTDSFQLENECLEHNDPDTVMVIMSCGAFHGILTKLQNR